MCGLSGFGQIWPVAWQFLDSPQLVVFITRAERMTATLNICLCAQRADGRKSMWQHAVCRTAFAGGDS